MYSSVYTTHNKHLKKKNEIERNYYAGGIMSRVMVKNRSIVRSRKKRAFIKIIFLSKVSCLSVAVR